MRSQGGESVKGTEEDQPGELRQGCTINHVKRFQWRTKPGVPHVAESAQRPSSLQRLAGGDLTCSTTSPAPALPHAPWTACRKSGVIVSLAPLISGRDWGSIPGSGRSSGEGNGNPPQYSCLEHPLDRRACELLSMRSQRVTRLSD